MNINLRDILNQHKQTTDLLEAEIKNLENLDLAKQNASLEKEAARLYEQLGSLRQKVSELNSSNSELREALYSRLYSEKLNFIENSQKKMEAYFVQGKQNEYNRLIEFENRLKHTIDTQLADIRDAGLRFNEELNARINSQIKQLRHEVSESIASLKTIETQTALIHNEMLAGYQRLRDEGISEQEIRHIAGKNKLERFLGINVINKIGLGLIILAVIFASQYTYTMMDDTMKCVLIFALGTAMIGTGQFLGRKKKTNVFSIGITAGGVAVTYIALTVGYFNFNLFESYTAAFICAGITAAAFFLSITNNSQVIATFSLIGGFLPIMAVEGALNYTMTFSAMAYFVILGGFALILSFRKKWIVTAFFGLTLNTVTTFYISSFFTSASPLPDKIILLLYMVVSFLIYTLIPIISTYTSGLHFKKSDITLIALNTFFSTLILYFNFRFLEIVDFNGLIPMMFMLIYMGLGQFIKWKMQAESDIRVLFYITSVVFFILIVPMHFDVIWLTFGWLLQGVGLCLYGILADKRKFTVSGFVINAFCLFSFLSVDLLSSSAKYFELKYFLITLGAVLIISAFAYKRVEHSGAKALKHLGFINLWIFLLYIIGRWHTEVLSNQFPWFVNLYSMICIPVTFMLACALPRIKPVYDTSMRKISHIIYTVGIVWLFILNFTRYDIGDNYVIVAIILALVNLLSVLALADMLHHHFKRSTLRSEWLPFLLSCYFMVILTQQFLVFYEVPFAGMSISLVYAGLALAWCIFGFIKRFTFMRRLGLGLTLAVVSKLFLIDFWNLTQGYRIITYFALGLALLAISFVYQHFTKKLEKLK
jgi:uncharacterized membrane protein